MDETNTYLFKVTGGFDVDKRFKAVKACDGTTIGFELPDGRIVRLVVGLEIEPAPVVNVPLGSDAAFGEAGSDGMNVDGETLPEPWQYITSESEMDKLGFGMLDYDQLDFEAEGEENEESDRSYD